MTYRTKTMVNAFDTEPTLPAQGMILHYAIILQHCSFHFKDLLNLLDTVCSLSTDGIS